MLPNITGGANWQGGSFDPETKLFYIFTNVDDQLDRLGQPPEPDRSDMLYVMRPARNPESDRDAGPARRRRWRRWR